MVAGSRRAGRAGADPTGPPRLGGAGLVPRSVGGTFDVEGGPARGIGTGDPIDYGQGSDRVTRTDRRTAAGGPGMARRRSALSRSRKAGWRTWWGCRTGRTASRVWRISF